MRVLRNLRAFALATLLVVPIIPAFAQGRPVDVDALIQRATNAINDLRYGEAATVARQVLALGTRLNRQQRISALQILTAAIYPEEKTVQRPDSAKVLMRRLVSMGLARGIPRSVAWAGLDSLYALVRAEPPAAGTGVQGEALLRDSLPAVLGLVEDKLPADEVIDRVRLDCDAVSFDSVDVALSRSRAPAGLGQALRGSCAQLVAVSEPSGATIALGGRALGVANPRRAWWVNPAPKASLVASLQGRQVSSDVALERGKSTEATFSFGADTLPWPLIPEPMQVATRLGVLSSWQPSSGRPQPPKKPKAGRSMKKSLLWGLVGAGAGGAVAFFTSAPGCYQKVPSGEIWLVKGSVYGSGETVGTPSCAAIVAAGAGAGTFLLSRFIGGGSSPAAMQRYDQQMAEYPAIAKRWEDQDKAQFAQNHPNVRRVIADSQARAMRVRAHNDSIRMGTAALNNVRVVVTDLGLTEMVSNRGVMSDVDTVTRRAAATNDDAVAVVIGNRDYAAAGTPKNELAVRDARSVRRHLVEGMGFKTDRVLFDTNATATRLGELLGTANNESVSQLADLLATRPPGTVDVVIYFNGYGAVDGAPQRRYLLPVDASPAEIASKGLALDQLFKNVAALNARSVTVLLETSFGSNAESGPIFAGRVMPVNGVLPASTRQQGIDVFAAASGDQVAHARADQGHGLFTYFALKGLQGAADRNGDRAVTVDELASYLRLAVPAWGLRMGASQQAPEIVPAAGDRALVRLAP